MKVGTVKGHVGPSPLEMRNLIAHPRGSHWDMNQIKLKDSCSYEMEIDLCVACM